LIYIQGQNSSPDNKHLQNSELCMTENFVIHSKGRGKVHPRAGHEGPVGECVYCSSLSLTSVLDWDPQSLNLVSPQHYVDANYITVITDNFENKQLLILFINTDLIYGQETVADIEGRIASRFDCLSYFVSCLYKEFALHRFSLLSQQFNFHNFASHNYCVLIQNHQIR